MLINDETVGPCNETALRNYREAVGDIGGRWQWIREACEGVEAAGHR